ncbi:hypothetical protein KW785_02980 [Candidatus Parcubacteria bacterium]|nr:hypothetical protein [Candidatus Parcubacteria bacterium]
MTVVATFFALKGDTRSGRILEKVLDLLARENATDIEVAFLDDPNGKLTGEGRAVSIFDSYKGNQFFFCLPSDKAVPLWAQGSVYCVGVTNRCSKNFQVERCARQIISVARKPYSDPKGRESYPWGLMKIKEVRRSRYGSPSRSSWHSERLQQPLQA